MEENEKKPDEAMAKLIDERVRAILNESPTGETREEELDQRERELRMRELRAETVETLAKRKLPSELADAISYTDEETCRKGLAAAEKAFRTAVQKAVDERLRGNTPGAGKAVDPDSLDDCDYYRVQLGL